MKGCFLQVTFREAAVLVDPDNTSADSKQWVAIVVNHEMAHQWFGECAIAHCLLTFST